MFDVCLLGCGGMMPLPHRALTSCIMRCEGACLLIDCGEGTQVSLHELGWSIKAVDAIFFTHYHGDHTAGLPGMLLSIGNAGRTEPLHIYGPKGLSRIVRGLLVIAPELPFDVVCHEISGLMEEEIRVGVLKVRAFRVDHGMPCYGYRVDMQRGRLFLPEKAKQNEVPLRLWSHLQKGETCEWEGRVYTPDQVLGEERKGLSVCYCTDSRPHQNIVEGARGADLFICEGMYSEEERRSRAHDYKHMTFAEAAMLAREAGAAELWLTHFSPALNRPRDVLPEAAAVFANTQVGKDRKIKELIYEEAGSDPGD